MQANKKQNETKHMFSYLNWIETDPATAIEFGGFFVEAFTSRIRHFAFFCLRFFPFKLRTHVWAQTLPIC